MTQSRYAIISLCTSILWYTIVLASAVYLASQPVRYQEWWLLPWIFAMVGAWLPFTLVSVLTGMKALKDIRNNPERLKGRGLAWTGIVMGAANPIVALLAFYTANAIRRGG